MESKSKGVKWFKIDGSDEVYYTKSEAQIQALINSSDMGINASRGQDFLWRLDPEWVGLVEEFKRDATKMNLLSSKHHGQTPTTVQILYAIYGEQVRLERQQKMDNIKPGEEEYLRRVAAAKKPKTTTKEVTSKKEQK